MAEIRPKTALAVLRTWPWILTVQPPKYSRQIEGSSRSMLVFLWSKSDNLRDGLPNRSTDRHTRIAPKNSTAACDRRTEGRGGVNIKINICEKSAVQWCGPTCVVCLSCQLIQFCGNYSQKPRQWVSVSAGTSGRNKVLTFAAVTLRTRVIFCWIASLNVGDILTVTWLSIAG